MATSKSDFMKLTDDDVRDQRTTALCFDIEKLDKAGVTVSLDNVALSFDILGGDNVSDDFEKFFENYDYSELEIDSFLNAALKAHNQVILSRILLSSK